MSTKICRCAKANKMRCERVMLCFTVFVYALITFVLGDSAASRLVRTLQGPVRGFKDVDNYLYAFYGIPYATAPRGTQKFKAPLPGPIWLETFEAVDKGIICPQINFLKTPAGNTTEEENCLIANVYVPDTEETHLPVVVYVHGGAFQLGFGNLRAPKSLVKSKKIVAVTFNYRLGAHGFLCLGTEDAPGNAGMKDQVALLRWVKKNIASFGGNPDDVTIAGYSAGATSVDLLMLSEAAKGLFNKVIPESAANIGACSIQQDPLENAKQYAQTLGFSNVHDIFALEDFYKAATYDDLTSVDVLSRLDSTFTFVPCVERDIGQEMFLADNPVNIIKQGKYQKVPILYGFANMEGLFRVAQFDAWKDKMNKNFSDFLPVDLKFPNILEKEKVVEKVKQFYFQGQSVSEKTILGYIDYFSDIIFVYPMLRAVKMHAEAGNNEIYLYEYSFVDEDTPFVPHTEVRGATHCAQTAAVLDETIPNKNISEDLNKMKDTMRELWINFITTGKPVPEGSSLPEWPAADGNRRPYMSLDRTLELRGELLQKRTQFWDEIYQEYYKPPLPPPVSPARHIEL